MTGRREDGPRYRDRFGREHSAAIFSTWSPAAITAMGIEPVEPQKPKAMTEAKQ